MAPKIDLSVLKTPGIPQGEADALDTIDKALNSSDDSVIIAANLADDLRRLVASSKSTSAADTLLWNLWVVLLDVVKVVPIEHPWHAALIAGVKNLLRRGGRVVELEDCTLNWEDLPDLSMYIFDKWADPTERDDHTSDDFETWKRWNSFASQLLSKEYMDWSILPYWEITAALEVPLPEDPTILECKIWVATEWLRHCADLLYSEMTCEVALDENSMASIKPGPLCEGVYPQSLERWEFWRSRLAQLAGEKPLGEGEDLGKGDAGQAVSSALLSRIKQAITAMDTASNNARGSDSNE
ncbi:hypothetical protein QBC41DRAFT_382266 [Cercophora samala]|uniref:Uncharacterized protein n=1 Tax=Cercophora samala TaxID=330535 RepID=A0AA40D3W0_9PEZI|nr:hypothetical protein QBC41DRAFT_382266 [Cercophora samala]